MQRYVVVSGLPASGKSTIGELLAASLKVPFLDKDAFLERLFESHGVGDAEWRSELSREADTEFLAAAAERQCAVLASWWKHPRSTDATGTPIDWLDSLSSDRVFEVFCRANPRYCFDRFMGRSRHPGHLDGRRNAVEFMNLLERQSKLGPLRCGTLIEIKTDAGKPMAALTSEVLENLPSLGWRVCDA